MRMFARRLTTTLILLLGIACLLPANLARAVTFQILHTNDLHASLHSAGEPRTGESEYGGWAQIKYKMDELASQAKAQGIETIRLDAGDFIEGTMLYFPNHGRDVVRAYLQMGYDASTMGNHDWIMGATALNRLLGLMPFTHPLLSANITAGSRMTHIRKQMSPYTVIDRGGVKIGVFGLSTTESFYKWITKVRSRANDLKIKDYLDKERKVHDPETGDETIEFTPGIANKTIQTLKNQEKTDAVIALTHIGFDEDLELINGTRGLDLVVGGHSHTFLETLSTEKDRDGREVPVVQTGYNGHSIGKVLIEIEKGKEPRVLTYELIDIPTNAPKDQVIAASAAQAEDELLKLYGNEYLDQELGKSEVRLVSGKFGPTAYSKFAVDALRESVDAQVAIDIGAFHSEKPQSAGIVTRRKLMEMYPRKFESDQNQGLYVYKAKIPGFVIALGIKFATKFGLFVSFGGIDYKIHKLTDEEYNKDLAKTKGYRKDMLGHYRAKNVMVGGQKICLTCVYEVAVPESLVRGAYGVSALTRLVIWGGKRSDTTIWQAFESYLAGIKVIRRLEDNEHFSPRRYSNGYQKKWGETIDPEQTLDEEGVDMSSANELDHMHEPSAAKMYEAFLEEVTGAQKSKIDDKTDIDELY